MKRITSVIISALALAVLAGAQTPTQTPNIGLYIPAHGTLNWDTWFNANWNTLDTRLGAAPASFPQSGVVTSTGNGWGSSLVAPSGNLVGNGQPNTYSAGSKQVFTPSGTTSGINFAGATSDPSSLSAGDLWFRSDNHRFKVNDGVSTRSLMYQSDSFPYGQLTGAPTIPTNISSFTNDSNYLTALPVPGVSTLGGVKLRTCTAGDFVNGVDNTGALICSTPAGGGGGGSTRTWLYAAMGMCQSSAAGAAIWLPSSSAPTYTSCDATHQQGEWQVPSATTSTNWGLGFRVPTGATGAYSLALTWRTADTTTGHAVTFTPSYACVAATGNPDNPSYTTLSTFTINPPGTANVNVDTTYSFTPTCAAGAQFRLLLTATTNTVTSPVSVSYESISLTANN